MSFQLHSQEGQDLSAVEAVEQLITHKSSESQNVDLTNKGMENHYLRDVEQGSPLYCVEQDRIFEIHFRLDI